MRIFYSPPKMGERFNHDSPLLKVMASGVTAFLLLSSITVFAGFALHFSLTGWRLTIYGLAIYPLLCLVPDLVNLACFSWFVRTLLKWQDPGKETARR
jgi:ABC-type multidrug transport system fused ATPase/permease subunit